ncbi:MAG TPA: M48 family metalloprotease, partial [Allosphingosinicella sp.]
MKRLLLSAAALALTLSSCGGGDGPPVTENERRVGAEQHPKLLAEFGGAYQAPEARYLAALGERVAVSAGLEGQCTFTLINSDVVNAFAVPGCFIYVTRGLMGLVNSEAELASVLAHELGHIVGNHSEEQQRRSLWRNIGVAAVSLVTRSERLAGLAGEAAAYFGLRYSRKQEYEADDLGLATLKAAGYDPYEAADMLGALGRNEQYMAATRSTDQAKAIPEWARTHPLTENRIARAREAATKTGVADNQLPEGILSYLEEVDGLLYGDDPRQG